MQGERLLRGSGIAQQVIVTEGWKPYRWNGQPGTDDAPEPVLPRGARAREVREARRQARLAEFGRRRAQGQDVAEAGAAVGVTAPTARKYEKQRQLRTGAA